MEPWAYFLTHALHDSSTSNSISDGFVERDFLFVGTVNQSPIIVIALETVEYFQTLKSTTPNLTNLWVVR